MDKELRRWNLAPLPLWCSLLLMVWAGRQRTFTRDWPPYSHPSGNNPMEEQSTGLDAAFPFPSCDPPSGASEVHVSPTIRTTGSRLVWQWIPDVFSSESNV